MGLSHVSHIENFQFFFQWLAYIKYEWFLQELEMACDFAIKISIYIVCRVKVLWFIQQLLRGIINSSKTQNP